MRNFSCSLYIVGTPIGNLGDISKRAIETLRKVDFVLCEDTRISGKLMKTIGINTKFIVYNDYNAQKIIPSIIEAMQNRQIVYALISDAGMPLISDPGYKLVNACIRNNISFTTVPGCSSVISALILSGMPGDRFMFCGFADDKKFNELVRINSTLIMFESSKRIEKTLQKINEFFADRDVVVVREITKIFEECIRGSVPEILDYFKLHVPRGEMVIVLSPPKTDYSHCLKQSLELIKDLKGKIPDTELSSIIAKHLGLSKNSVYNFIKTLL